MSKPVEDKRMFFIYTKGGVKHINTCYGIKELSKFLNRQEWRIEKDLEKIKLKRKAESRLIKDKNGRIYTILTEKEMRKEMMIGEEK